MTDEKWTEPESGHYGECPDCKRPTTRRLGGEWCPWCRGFVVERKTYREESGSGVVRTIATRYL